MEEFCGYKDKEDNTFEDELECKRGKGIYYQLIERGKNIDNYNGGLKKETLMEHLKYLREHVK